MVTQKPAGATLQLFFIDGKPDGMLTADVFGWTGHILLAPRTRLPEALKRKEASYTGVYLLLGESDNAPLVYIGEGENVANRIKSHDANKDWWSQVVFITSSANNLHKAHVQYLESRLIDLAINAANTQLENGNHPALPGLSEADRANMEAFIEQVLMVLPAVRVDTFTTKAKPSNSARPNNDVVAFELTLKKENIYATALLTDGEFIVQKGSLARGEFIHPTHNYRKLYEHLCAQGILAPHNEHRIFTENYAFSSTSAAGAICNGRPTAGPLDWKLKGTSKTYKQWEAENLEK